jgi:hypothetical protein
MEKAGKNYWQDADAAKRKVLVVMAESLDETSRRKIRLEELRISIDHEEARSAFEQLTQACTLIPASAWLSAAAGFSGIIRRTASERVCKGFSPQTEDDGE